MKKADYEHTLRTELLKIPKETRDTWDGTKLCIWWTEYTQKNSWVKWDRDSGNPWDTAYIICKDLIGIKD